MKALQLPEPNDELLARSPLSLVVCQVRHDRLLAVADARRGLEVQDLLGDLYPKLEQWSSRQTTFTVDRDQVPQVLHDQASAGWQMKSDDEAWTVTLDADFFSLETSAYADWADFRKRLEALVGAVLKVYEPSLESRLGLRYVDEITHPSVSVPSEWRGWIREELLGPLTHPDFAAAVSLVQQHVELDAGDGYWVVLRHGTQQGPRAEWMYLLDHDCFSQVSRPFVHNDVLKAADDLNRIALQVFQSAITSEMYNYLKGDGGDTK